MSDYSAFPITGGATVRLRGSQRFTATEVFDLQNKRDTQRQLGQQSTVSRDNEINPFVSASLNEASRSTRLVVNTARWVQRAQPWGLGARWGADQASNRFWNPAQQKTV
ncbi:hypothetical protein [Rhodococcus sp. BH5]|uniref:hypothetical protein n=1 Tax=Rhodococcus sp. BH5 TaxID=2871702 RepID=UPI0022CD3D35|nr:hypothetical protein [Rhodococcus sp. BH5]MCZ9635357.1 hypothetical protein [Rhodococcus sp. BH5]